MPLRWWPYKRVFFRCPDTHTEFDIVGHNGAFHVLKRLSLQLCSSGRKLRWGSLWADTTPMLQYNLPHKTYGASDLMSDKASAHRLCPPYLERSAFLLGQHMLSLVAALICSCTTASKAFSKYEHALNALTAFYMLCIHIAQNKDCHRQDWQRWTLSLTTLRNTLALTGFAVHASMTEVEPCNVQEINIERFFSAIKAPFRGSASIRDMIQGEAQHHLSQIRQLDRLADSARGVPEHVSPQSRDPMTMEQLQQCSKEALAASLQVMAWATVDGSCDDLWYATNHWFNEHAASVFQSSVDLEQDDNDFDIHDEELADAELDGEQPDDASATARLGLLQRDEPEQDETEEPTIEPGPRNLPEQLIEEGFDPKVQPKTLIDILKQTINNPKHKDKAVWNLGEEGSLGDRACLMRVQMLQKALRHCIKYTRMEENLLSCAMIERGVANSRSPWNQREYLLHMARRNANLAKTRLSRLQMWSSAQDIVLQKVAEVGHNEGLLKVKAFRPCSKECDAQILALRIEDTVQLAITLAVFRGAVVRNPKKPEATRIRTSKPIPVPLQAEYAKLLHCVRLEHDDSRDEYTCSCISDVLMVTPVNTIIGEVHGQVSCSSLRLHFKLSDASKAALAMLPNIDIPTLRENSGAQASEDRADVGLDQSAMVSFNDRSFSRTSLDANCKLFLERVLREYRSKGTPVEVPSYFLQLLRDSKGFRFSSSVFNHLKVLLPDRRQPTTRRIVEFFTDVWKIAPAV
ncbi:unnamed protein product, partial [Symbiodinium necroappetens]